MAGFIFGHFFVSHCCGVSCLFIYFGAEKLFLVSAFVANITGSLCIISPCLIAQLGYRLKCSCGFQLAVNKKYAKR